MADLAGAPRLPSTGQVEALERCIRADRVQYGLSVLRFIGHPRMGEVWPAYLVCLYHSMRTAGPLMEAARERCAELAVDCPVAARLEPYWASHIAEERGHDRWLLADLRAYGLDPEAAVADLPSPDVAELMGTLSFWVNEVHPVGALAYFYVVEGGPPSTELLDWLVASRGLPRDGLVTFYRHAEIDREHGRELEELVEELPLAERHARLLGTAASTALRQLTGIFDALRSRL